MYKIVVADDEEIIRKTLIHNFHKEIYADFEVFEAADGEDALEIIKQNQPDIVVTDIKMPVIDGLALSAMVKKLFADTVVIVLSGYSEFAFVRNALNLGVFDYLLKPVKEEELDAIIAKAVQLIEKQVLQKAQESLVKYQIDEGNRAIKENFLNKLVATNLPITDAVYLKTNMLMGKIDFRNFFTAVFAAKEESVSGDGRMDDDFYADFFKLSIPRIIDECCKEYVEKYDFFTTADFHFVLIIDDLTAGAEEAKELINKIKESVELLLKIEIFVGVSKNYDGLNNFKNAYGESCEKLEMKEFLGRDEEVPAIEESSQKSDSIFKQQEKSFINSIYLCDITKVNDIIDGTFAQVRKTELSLSQLNYFKFQLINCIVEIAREVDFDLESLFGNEKSIYEKSQELKQIGKYKEFVNEIAVTLIEHIKNKYSDRKKKAFDEILKYVDEHFAEDLTLYKLSEIFFIEYSYLSKMFKENSGKLFSKYLIDIRIKKSKELLTFSNKKVYEISEEVGYLDIKHFTKLFKESEGMTPLEYRKSKEIIHTDREESDE